MEKDGYETWISKDFWKSTKLSYFSMGTNIIWYKLLSFKKRGVKMVIRQKSNNNILIWVLNNVIIFRWANKIDNLFWGFFLGTKCISAIYKDNIMYTLICTLLI